MKAETLRSNATTELQTRICAHASTVGRSATALPEVWFFRADAPESIVRMRAPMMTLAIAASGTKRVRIGPLALANDPMQFLVLHGGRSYDATVQASPTNPYTAMKLQLPPDIIARTLLDLADNGTAPPKGAKSPVPAFVGPVDELLAEPLCRILACLDDPLERRIIAPLCLREIVFRLFQSDAASVLRTSMTVERTRISRAMKFVEQNAPERLTVDVIARAVAMSPSHFAHRFRELAGMSPMQYVKLTRLEQARLLLLDESVSTSRAAEHVGYASVSHFAKDFKRQFGVTPSKYVSTFSRQSTVAVDGD